MTMMRIGFGLAILAIVSMATWAYHVNYRTKTTLKRVERLRTEIADTRESIEVLRVEWAWLNSPDRLTTLVARHPELALAPMAPENFGRAASAPFPPLPEPEPEPAPSLENEIDALVAEALALAGPEPVVGLSARNATPVPPHRPGEAAE